MSEEIIKTVLRIPEPLYEKVKELAEQERRSINNQLLFLLEQGMQTYSCQERI